MSRKLINTVAHAMCYAFGIRANAFKLEDRLSIPGLVLSQALVRYTMPCMDMIEAAQAVAMGMPSEDTPRAVAGRFGSKYAEFCKSHQEFPDHLGALGMIKEAVVYSFQDDMTQQQKEILSKKLDEIVTQYEEEDE